MKRFWLILQACLAFVLCGLFLGFSMTLHGWVFVIAECLFCGPLFIWGWFVNYRKNPVVLTEEELRAPVTERQDFSNRYTLMDYAMTPLLVIMIIPMFAGGHIFQDILTGYTFEDALTRYFIVLKKIGHSVTFILMCVVMVALLIRTSLQQGRNKYIIDGDTLIIQENWVLKSEEEVRIPVSCIDAVYTSSGLSLNPMVWIKVDGIYRRCYAVSHARKLAKAILQHKYALQKGVA
ncbi:MAG: hypothetical protein IJ249_08535 [Paludibacteraceae bacterium]|nr:hypothetical protein [Paludibacteraceae bacterium]